MHYTLLETKAQITCTLEELVKMESLDQCIYATPDLQGTMVQLYIASRPASRDDFMLVDVEDFLAEMELDTEVESCGPEKAMIAVPAGLDCRPLHLRPTCPKSVCRFDRRRSARLR